MSQRNGHRFGRDEFRSAVASTDAAFVSLRSLTATAIKEIEDVVETLIDQLATSDALLLPVFGSGPRSSAAAPVAVYVSALALAIGAKLRYPRPELVELGLVALLHDVGRRNPAHGHASREGGAMLSHAFGPAYARVASLVAQAEQHRHDSRADGDQGVAVPPLAQIVALAATYERVARQQPSGPSTWPPTAVKELIRRERARTADAILKAAIEVLVALPVGGLVRLNSGEIARVMRKNDRLPLRPVVAVTARSGPQSADRKVIDLRDTPFLHVAEFLGDNRIDIETEDPA
jgi:HD-GYP domain-containing protein (c-di-GMP phosphodiesterase class II)